MGQSLAADAVGGINTSSYVPSPEALEALQQGDTTALLAAQKARFAGFFMGPEDDGDDDEDDDADDDGDGDDADDEDEDDDEDDDKPKGKSKRVKELSNEAAKRRRENQQLKKDLEAANKRLKEIDDADKSELDKATERVTELESTNEELTDRLEAMSIQMAFISNTKFKWKNPAAALKLADLDEVEIGEDGKVTGMEEALKALAKSDPYLLADSDDEDDDEDDEDERPQRRRSASTGRAPGRRSKGKGKDRNALVGKYPALSNR